MIIPLPCRTLLLALVISVLGFQPLKAQQPASLSGTWYGELNLVVQKLRIGMKIASTPGGAFKGTLDSIDQSAFGIPLTLVTREEDKVRIEIESLGVVSIDEQILLQNLRHEYGISSESARQIFEEEKASIASATSTVDEDDAVTDDAVESAATEDETAAAASSKGSSLLWVLVGAAAGIGAYLYFGGVFQ